MAYPYTFSSGASCVGVVKKNGYMYAKCYIKTNAPNGTTLQVPIRAAIGTPTAEQVNVLTATVSGSCVVLDVPIYARGGTKTQVQVLSNGDSFGITVPTTVGTTYNNDWDSLSKYTGSQYFATSTKAVFSAGDGIFTSSSDKQLEVAVTYNNGTFSYKAPSIAREGYKCIGWVPANSITSALSGCTLSATAAETSIFPLDYTRSAVWWYPLWEALPSYTLTYNANGGSLGNVPSTQTFASGSCTLSSYEPTRSGYTFKGWGTSSSATSSSYAAGSTQPFTANKTIYAIWEGKVTYDANGGSGAPAAQTFIAGKSITVSSTKPTRSGYTFVIWATSLSTSSDSYQPGDTFTPSSGNPTLYAVWKGNTTTYTVSFDYQGGTGSTSKLSCTAGQSIIIPANPVRQGYEFKGFDISKTGTGYLNEGMSYTPSGNVTLYAIWQEVVELQAPSSLEFIGYQRRNSIISRGFYPAPVMRCLPAKMIQGDSVETIPPNLGDVLDFYTNISAQQYNYGVQPSSQTYISSYDDAFVRYNASDRKVYLQGNTATDTQSTLGDDSDYKYWLRGHTLVSPVKYDTTDWVTYDLPRVASSYTITFEANGGTISQSKKTVDINDPQYEFPTATRSGFAFDGWTLKNMPNPVRWYPRFDDIADKGLYGNLTYVAKWSTQPKVRFRAAYVSYNSSVQNMPADKLCSSSSIVIPDTAPTLEGYTFTGWSTSMYADEIDERYFPGDTFTLPGSDSVTLFAQFTYGDAPITITFDPQGGQCSTQKVNTTVNSTLKSVPDAAYEGKRFLGWFTSSTGGTEVNGSTVLRQSMTLYAHWETIVYKLTFSAGEGKIKGTGKQSAELSVAHGESLESSGLTAPIAELEGMHFVGWYSADGTRFEVTTQYEADTSFTARYIEDNIYGCLPIIIDSKPVAARPYIVKDGKWMRGSEHVYTASKWEITSCPSEYAYVPLVERVAHMPRIDGITVYTGNSVSPTLVNYYSSEIVLTGATSAIEAGNYILRATPKPGYVWEDGSKVTRDIPWEILESAPKIKLTAEDIPVQTNVPEYTGSPITPTFAYDSAKMTISVSPATNAGEYEAIVTATDDYEWEDDMT